MLLTERRQAASGWRHSVMTELHILPEMQEKNNNLPRLCVMRSWFRRPMLTKPPDMLDTLLIYV